MIIIDIKIKFNEALTEATKKAFQRMDIETQKENGCIKYISSESLSESNTVYIHEIWESKEQLIPHFQTPHMQEFQAALGNLTTTEYQAKAYDANGEIPFDSFRN